MIPNMALLVHSGRLIPPFWLRLILLPGVIALTATAGAAAKADPAFEKDVLLAPFVVNGKPLSISILARASADRRYAENFAEEVVAVAYETLGGESTGKGLVVIGREGEPHPVVVIRKFLAMAAAGELAPAVAAQAGELTAKLADWKAMIHQEEDPKRKGITVTLDMLGPALPMPLEGVSSKLYQLCWAEDFDDARVERKLRSLTVVDLESDALSKYDWVFYLPPRTAFKGVMDEAFKQGMKREKVGLFKRAALKSALLVFSPAIKVAVEGMRKGILLLTVLRAESDYGKEDIMMLSGAYMEVLMPDLKFNGGTEHKRALEAIEAQKIKNAEYAKDPFVSPARLTGFDSAAYAPFEGEYTLGKGKEKEERIWSFQRKDDAYLWQYNARPPRIFHPAGDRLLVAADGKMTIEFQLDAKGAVTGVEARRARHRQAFPRKL